MPIGVRGIFDVGILHDTQYVDTLTLYIVCLEIFSKKIKKVKVFPDFSMVLLINTPGIIYGRAFKRVLLKGGVADGTEQN